MPPQFGALLVEWGAGAMVLVATAAWLWARANPRPRLPHRVDPALQRVTTRAQLDAVVAHGCAEPLMCRAWTAERRADARVVRVLQFNTLAHGLSALPAAPMPFRATAPPSSGGLDRVECPERTLDWERRRWLLLAEVLRHDADVIALQEVDHFADFFEPALDAAGYDALFQPVSAPSSGEKFGGYTDGVALAWRREALGLVRVHAMRAGCAGRASIVATLAPTRAGGRPLVVASAHLTARTGQAREDQRARQVGTLLADIERARRGADGTRSASPVILAGDLNTDPHDVRHPHPHVAKALPKLMAYGLRSSYPLARGEDAHGAGSALWTTWKRRGEYEAKHQIDYIFTIGATCLARLEPPSDAHVGEARLPSPRYPSDHIAIAADLLLD
ncbi:hypothetical protein KFE25_011564 [Diacronema lutheri]|uniref:Endonuclease/exonuclease/phosphatase domain-containing protein n=1 Tax=Diacronema lutheri TaxID=2081491 RepID=A0A8J6C6P7_DIALT|nr:hypothetical protein KFE25_011564 [Diacronema lutheri]